MIYSTLAFYFLTNNKKHLCRNESRKSTYFKIGRFFFFNNKSIFLFCEEAGVNGVGKRMPRGYQKHSTWNIIKIRRGCNKLVDEEKFCIHICAGKQFDKCETCFIKRKFFCENEVKETYLKRHMKRCIVLKETRVIKNLLCFNWVSKNFTTET